MEMLRAGNWKHVSENLWLKNIWEGSKGNCLVLKIFFSTKNVDQDLSFYWKIENHEVFQPPSNLPRLPFIYLFSLFHKGIFQPLIHQVKKKKKELSLNLPVPPSLS